MKLIKKSLLLGLVCTLITQAASAVVPTGTATVKFIGVGSNGVWHAYDANDIDLGTVTKTDVWAFRKQQRRSQQSSSSGTAFVASTSSNQQGQGSAKRGRSPESNQEYSICLAEIENKSKQLTPQTVFQCDHGSELHSSCVQTQIDTQGNNARCPICRALQTSSSLTQNQPQASAFDLGMLSSNSFRQSVIAAALNNDRSTYDRLMAPVMLETTRGNTLALLFQMAILIELLDAGATQMNAQSLSQANSSVDQQE